MEAVGDILYPTLASRSEGVVRGTLDAQSAASEVLAGFLRQAVFVRIGYPLAGDVTFKLCRVSSGWPEPSQALDYPSASIVEQGVVSMMAHNHTPTALDSTWNTYGPNTILWKISEMSCLFQIDFWTSQEADRRAISAALPGLMAPGEDRSCVVLRGHPLYFSLPVRAYLESIERVDNPLSVYQNERRLSAKIRCDLDVVELRCVNEITPQVTIVAEDFGG